MRDGRASFTAAFVATLRTLGRALPADARLADDPHGAALAGPLAERLAAFAPHAPAVVARIPMVLYMQVRTRAIDDVVLRFVRGGGRQVVLFGAGFDCRAVRLDLQGATVFEVDHPATQAKKRAAVVGSPARYIAWDFERDPMDALPARLAEHGHDATLPTITIWEGVVMYLAPGAVDRSLAAMRAYGAPGSKLAMTYFDRALLERPSLLRLVVGGVVAAAGEPFRFGLAPDETAGFLAARGFVLEDDRDMGELSRSLLPARWARRVHEPGSRLAVASMAAPATARRA